MRVLLDTHTVLWFLAADPALSPGARAVLEDPTMDLCLSMASLWEMAIKVSLGKLQLATPFDTLQATLLDRGITVLPIDYTHVRRLTSLPFHHRDPFDRMLVVQALEAPMPLVSRDPALDAYGVTRWW